MIFLKKKFATALSGDTEAVAVNPSHVRLAPLWIAEEKSWKVTTVQLHVQESPEVH